uniref:Uncharacterized protein n=1 Tax=Panagrolaimus sp. JU765 TaxID=591449 RepID=A0AC34QV43_9BILA
DGIISLYEMEQFYEEVFHKLITKRFGALKFKDMINQVLDMVNPKDGKIRRSDLKQCKLAHKFFNTFVNVNKYVEQESDSFADLLAIRESDWEQFSARQYKHFLELEAEYERMENE